MLPCCVHVHSANYVHSAMSSIYPIQTFTISEASIHIVMQLASSRFAPSRGLHFPYVIIDIQQHVLTTALSFAASLSCPQDTHECVSDPAARATNGTKCVKKQKCAAKQSVCGRSKAAGQILLNPDDKCCPADKQCYIVDQPQGAFKTVCSTCATPCGRAQVDGPGDDDRCCKPRQTCTAAFHGTAPPVTTRCAYAFACAKDTCKNGGRCAEDDFPYQGQFKKCHCEPGFTGVFCEIKKA